MANRYWVGGTGNWSDDTNHWSTTSGGAAALGNLPTAADDVFFDANSFNNSYSMTVDALAYCKNMTWSNLVLGTPAWWGTFGVEIYGSLTLASIMTVPGTGTLTFKSTTTGNTITTLGRTQNKPYTFDGVGGEWTITDTFNIGVGRNITVTNGSLIMDGRSVTGGLSSNNANVRNISAIGTTFVSCVIWDFTNPANLTYDFTNSTITFLCNVTSYRTFLGGGLTYNNLVLTNTSTGSNRISGSNTFNDITASTGMPGKTISFATGTTQTVTSFTVSGTAGNEITITSYTTTATHALIKAGGGVISCDYLNIQHSVATPANTWYAGVNSTNNQAVATAGSGWIFTVPPGGTVIKDIIGRGIVPFKR